VALAFVGAIRSAYQDGLLQRRALDRVRAYASEQQVDIQRLHRAGKARWRAARDLSDGGQHVAALFLYQQAATLFVWAARRAQPGSEPRELESVSEAFAALDELGLELPAGSEPVRDLLRQTQPLAFEQIPTGDLATVCASADQLVSFLGRTVEPRSVRAVKIRRALHLGAIVLGFLLAITALVVWLTRPKNIARGKPVSSSGLNPDSTAPDDGLVDGDTRGSYGIHTSKGPNPWVAIDLGKTHSIGRIEIFNRGDGWLDDGLPMVLEVSEDGSTYTEIAVRKKRFTHTAPWVERLGGKPARWVRVRGRTGSYVALSEIEVYEKR
jgi:hypothetical protein